MKFIMNLSDLKTILSKLAPIAEKADKSNLRHLKFDFTAQNDTANLVVTVLDDYCAAALAFAVLNYEGPKTTTLYIPPFKLPTGIPKDSPVVFTTSEDDQFVTLDFGIGKFVQHLFNPLPGGGFPHWSKILPKKEPTLAIWFDPKILEKTLKACDVNYAYPVKLEFYSLLEPAIITQGDNSVAFALPVRAKETPKSILLSELSINH